MDRKAFACVKRFIKAKPAVLLITMALMLALSFGEKLLSDVLISASLTYADYGLAIIRMILQSALSTILVFSWHKYYNCAAPFAAVDILKLFVSSLITTLLITTSVVLVVLIPLGIWLFLRMDFFMNYYITGKSNGIFSCIGTSFRRSKGFAKRYLVYNIKYLLFYFIVELALAATAMVQATYPFPDAVNTALDIFDVVFTSVFLPYRFLTKCGFYQIYLHTEETDA